MHDSLCSPNLSHMDFLDDPAAIHGCRLIISRAKQDASPNELMNPEILMKHHQISIYSFGWFWPAIFPACVISSCACMILLSEASSSSNVKLIIARQRETLGRDTSIWACLTASNHEIYHIFHHARDLDVA